MKHITYIAQRLSIIIDTKLSVSRDHIGHQVCPCLNIAYVLIKLFLLGDRDPMQATMQEFRLTELVKILRSILASGGPRV